MLDYTNPDNPHFVRFIEGAGKAPETNSFVEEIEDQKISDSIEDDHILELLENYEINEILTRIVENTSPNLPLFDTILRGANTQQTESSLAPLVDDEVQLNEYLNGAAKTGGKKGFWSATKKLRSKIEGFIVEAEQTTEGMDDQYLLEEQKGLDNAEIVADLLVGNIVKAELDRITQTIEESQKDRIDEFVLRFKEDVRSGLDTEQSFILASKLLIIVFENAQKRTDFWKTKINNLPNEQKSKRGRRPDNRSQETKDHSKHVDDVARY